MKSAAIGSSFISDGKKVSKRFRRESDPKTRAALAYSKTLTLPATTRFAIWRDMPRPEPRY